MKSSIKVRYVYAPKVEQNCATHLNRAKRTVYPLGSKFKVPRSTRSLEQMSLLGHTSTKQHCEIQCEALEFSDEQMTLIRDATIIDFVGTIIV